MNSVALPTTASAPTLSAEADLVRQAARGEAAAFAELFRRHGQMAWRLAQAVAVDRDAAVAAVGNGFAKSLRGGRRNQTDPGGGFRTLVLSAVYRIAMEDARAQGGHASLAAPAPVPVASKGGKSARSRAKRDDSVLVEAAFRSLPERWRAALWLSEVEAMTADRLAPVLGVSEAVVAQLVTRGTRGFAGRFAQAHRPVPTHLGPALRQVALAMPANLADVTAVRLKAVSSDPGLRFAPISAWLNERAARPLQVAVGGLLGIGLIGIGLLQPSTTVPAGPVAISKPATGTAPTVSGFMPGSSANGASPSGGGFSSAFTGAAAGTGGGAVATAAGAAGTTTPTTGAGSGSKGSPPPSNNPPPSGSGGQPGTGPGTLPGGTPGSGSPTNTILPLAPVATVTQTGYAITANVLPAATGNPVASLTVGCSSGVGLTVGTTTIGCASPKSPKAPAKPATTTTTLPLVGGLLSGLGNTLGHL